ncbi:tetratricopeptide repeat protein [uncultured Erythrobacter sp.]|uniref:tetratricopeptide repeat protein n=1 Tax=uncultured Erythrobacter sp. TaxID=263913 RepID=UPI0026225D51|nr:tetratricopeptide repeat protein [uncultured Erythrobacter sp.]
MLLSSSLLAFALQVGPNPVTLPPTDGHQELRDRNPRVEDQETAQNPASEWLVECLDLLEQDASRAHTMAQIQRIGTVGPERVLANHCLGLAASELGLWEDAISAFEAARDETPDAEMQLKARFGTMAGNAALASANLPRADAILRRAKSDAQSAASAPLQAIAATDLARVLVALEQADAALAELDLATSLQPDNAESWLLKATLLRRLERLEEAQPAIERASELSPSDPLVGLEAGIIALFSGREEAARASWQSVIDLDPDGPAAQIAQNYLAQISAPPPQNQP